MKDLQAVLETFLQSSPPHVSAMHLADSQTGERTQRRTFALCAQFLGSITPAGMTLRFHHQEIRSTSEMRADFRLESFGGQYRIGDKHTVLF